MLELPCSLESVPTSLGFRRLHLGGVTPSCLQAEGQLHHLGYYQSCSLILVPFPPASSLPTRCKRMPSVALVVQFLRPSLLRKNLRSRCWCAFSWKVAHLVFSMSGMTVHACLPRTQACYKPRATFITENCHRGILC